MLFKNIKNDRFIDRFVKFLKLRSNVSFMNKELSRNKKVVEAIICSNRYMIFLKTNLSTTQLTD